MTVAVAQETSNEDPNFGTAGTSIAKAFAGACTNPSVIHAIVTCDTDVSATVGVSDPTNGAYTVLDKFFDSGSVTFNAHFYVKNTGTTALTVTCAFGATVHIKGIIIREVTGADSATPVNPSTAHAGQEQASPSTSADAVTSGTFSTPNLPGLISALSKDDSGSGVPAAGTGFTSTFTTWAFGGSILARTEHKRVTAGSTQAGTFTAGGTGRPHGTLAVLFVEAGVGGAPQVGQPWQQQGQMGAMVCQ